MTQRPTFLRVSGHLTVSEVVAELKSAGLDVSGDALRRWIRNGIVPAQKLRTGQYQIHPDVVSALKCGADPFEALADSEEAERIV
jgi:hypothetical protein